VAKWAEFQRRYQTELNGNPLIPQLKNIIIEKGTVTFVYAARDEEHNSALLLKEFMMR
jgi:uncharacterized protein YeaO (DUF488 family)